MTSTAPGRFRLEKHRWIAEAVPNRTFADVGGLGGTVNETVSLALRHGVINQLVGGGEDGVINDNYFCRAKTS